MRRNYREIDG